MKKILIILAMALVAALALGLVACNAGGDNTGGSGGNISGNIPGTGGETNDDIFDTLDTAKEIYGFSAASAGMLISAMNNGSAAVAAAETDTNGTPAVDAVTAELDRYMALVESLLSDGGFTVTEEASDRAEYEVKSVITYRDMQGNTLGYVMYYNQRLIPDYDDDDDDEPFEVEEEYAIEGIMIIDGVEYPVRGERSNESEPGESESETEFFVTLSDTRYMLVEQSVEEEQGETEREYEYSVYEGRTRVEYSSFEYENERDETEIKMTSFANGQSQIFYFEKENVRGEEVIRIRVGSAQSSEGYYVHIVTDAETGETRYEYEQIARR